MRSRALTRAPSLLSGLALAVLVFGGAPLPASADHHEMDPSAAKPLNPCAGKNPCAAKNPCAGENPCAGKNPCAEKNVCAPKNPCAGKNPCSGGAAVNPCRFKQPAGAQPGGGDPAALLARGEQLWQDRSLSTNGAACGTCHQGHAQFQASFATPYPHNVAMVEQSSGVAQVSAAEMVQFCMLQPMQAEPLAWGSVELAALTAYVQHLQKEYAPNPCAMKNPCSGGH